jgi:hypothetical protein
VKVMRNAGFFGPGDVSKQFVNEHQNGTYNE